MFCFKMKYSCLTFAFKIFESSRDGTYLVTVYDKLQVVALAADFPVEFVLNRPSNRGLDLRALELVSGPGPVASAPEP